MKLGLSALAVFLLPLSAQNAPQVRGTAAGAKDFPVAPLRSEPKVAWEARPGFRDFGSMVLSNNILVTGNVTGNGTVAAFDAATGKLLWRTPGGQMRGEPAADATAAYALSLSQGFARRLQAFDLKTGKLRWSVEAGKLGFFTPLLLDAGRLYLAGENGKAAAFDAANGKLLWEVPYSPGRGQCPTGFAAAGGLVYFGGGDDDYHGSKGKYLWALDAATGQERWRFMARPDAYVRTGACVSAPAVSDGVVTTVSGHVLYALDAATGALKWSREVRRPLDGRGTRRPLAEPAIAGGVVYSYFQEGILGWRLASGEPAFELAAAMPGEQYFTRLAIAGGVMYFTANLEQPWNEARGNGYLYALDLATRRILWKHRTARPSPYQGEANWRTRFFLPADGALFYETNSLLAKLQ